MTGVNLDIRKPGQTATDPSVWPGDGPLATSTLHVAASGPSGPILRADVALFRGKGAQAVVAALLPALRGMGPLYSAAVRGLSPHVTALASAIDTLPAGSAVLSWDGVATLAVEWHPGPCESWPGAEPSAHRLPS